MQGRQGCLVGCVRTEPSVGKGFRTHLTQQDVANRYRTYTRNRMQGPGGESQDATLLDLTQATFLLMDATAGPLHSWDKRELAPQTVPIWFEIFPVQERVHCLAGCGWRVSGVWLRVSESWALDVAGVELIWILLCDSWRQPSQGVVDYKYQRCWSLGATCSGVPEVREVVWRFASTFRWLTTYARAKHDNGGGQLTLSSSCEFRIKN